MIDQKKQLENINEMGVRSALITGGLRRICNELEPIAFVFKINMIPSVVEKVVVQGPNHDVVDDEDTILNMENELGGAECQ